MNTQILRSLLSRQNVVPFTFFLLIIVVVFGLTRTSATAGGGSGQGNQRPPMPSDEELKKDFKDDDLKTKDDKPAGNWSYGTLLDSKQMNDPTVPVYVRSIQIVTGGGKYQFINKIKRIQVTNKTSLIIVSVQVRVEVVHFDEPEKIQLENELPFVNVTIDPDSSQVVEITTIHPPRLLKALAKDGELSGDFRIRISMQAVRFADGSFWRRQPTPAALLSSPYFDLWSLGLKFPDLASLTDHIAPPLRSPDTKQDAMARCTGEPRLSASAFSSVRFELGNNIVDAPSVAADNITPIWLRLRGGGDYSPVSHFASACFPFSVAHTYMLSLTAYMDETGHSSDERQRFNGMVGLIAPAADWEVLERKWKATLARKEFDIPYFHMKDFANFKSFYKGWNEAKRQNLFRRLMSHLETIYPMPIGISTPMEVLRTFPKEQRRYFGDPYYLAFQGVIYYATRVVESMSPEEKVALIFSEQKEFRSFALKAYEAMQKTRIVKRRTYSPAFRDMKEFAPLQAADIVAYEV